MYIEFRFIWLNNLKIVERRKSEFFLLKYSFCNPLGSEALAPFLPPVTHLVPQRKVISYVTRMD